MKKSRPEAIASLSLSYLTKLGPSASAFTISVLLSLRNLKNVIAIYAIPIPPKKCVVDLHMRIPLGKTSTEGKILHHAVVNHDIDSNNPSTNLLQREKFSIWLGSGNPANIKTIAEIIHAIIQARNTICTHLVRLVHVTTCFGLIKYPMTAHQADKANPTQRSHGCSVGNLGSAWNT